MFRPDRSFRWGLTKNGPPRSRQIPSNCESIAGADGDFTLYEDENDNYNYEKGVYATIPLHWDDKAQTLTIGERKGQFPGMLENRTFRVVLVRETHGVGVNASDEPDKVVQYSGKQMSVTR